MPAARSFSIYFILLSTCAGLIRPGTLFSQEAEWVQGITGTPFFYDLQLTTVIHTGDGGALVGGYFYGDLQFGTFGDGIAVVPPTFNDYSFFARFSPDGQPQWVKTFENQEVGGLAVLAIDQDGHIYVGGSFSGSIDLGDADNPIVITSTAYNPALPKSDGVLVKLSSTGDYIWHRQFTGANSGQVGRGIITQSGNILFILGFTNDMTLPNAMGDTLLIGSGNVRDNAIAEYTPEGDFVQVLTVIGDLIGGIGAIAEDEQGGRYATGYYLGEKVIEANGGSYTLQAPPDGSGYGSYVFKYNAEGDINWVRPIHGLGQENAFLLATDFTSGQLYVGGFFDGDLYVENQNLQDTITSYGARDMFVISFDSNGELLWSRVMGGQSDDLIAGIQYVEGGFVLYGSVSGEMFFDQNNASPTYDATYAGLGLVGYNTDGHLQWTYFRSGDDPVLTGASANAFTTDNSNNMFLIGGALNINFGTDASPVTFVNPFGANNGYGFLLKMQAPLISGTDNWASTDGFSVYPVPAKDIVNIKITHPGNYTMEVRNTQGQLISHGTVREETTTIDVSSYSQGTYLMILQKDDGWRFVRRFIVVK